MDYLSEKKTTVLQFQLSVSRWADKGGGMNEELCKSAQDSLNETLDKIQNKDYEDIFDIKVNHFVVSRHNNGGADEVWVQYTIIHGC